MKGTVIEGTKALLRHETFMHSCCIFANEVRLLYRLLSTGLINQINNYTRAEFINLNICFVFLRSLCVCKLPTNNAEQTETEYHICISSKSGG